ncbi:uncharacterized protein LOC120067518 [Benincasa hispida]|uniref:uncharacterized protein LOC120067518 n=1 Tax=Benincasa hispida TaxID=102211 RepID=UPI0019010F16|nr:uncharacterized protein LOC120067518 [Benincasa hispida]
MESLLKQYIEKNETVLQNQATSFHNLEIQIGQIAGKLKSRPQGALPSSTELPRNSGNTLNVGQLVPTTVTLQLADRSLVHPEGEVKDVLVSNDKFILLPDFIILDYEANKDVPIILGRPFLSTGRVQIDVYKGEITLSVNGKELRFDIIKAMKYPEEEDLTDSDNEPSCNEKEVSEDENEREDANASIATCNAIMETTTKEEKLTLNEERKA